MPIALICYRYLRYWINRYFLKFQLRDQKIYNNKLSSCIASNKENSFFGYYNNSPMNNKGDIIFCSVKTDEVRGSCFEPVKIYIKTNNRTEQVANSKTWNWQQGCMLQWHPASDETIIYNDYSSEENTYISKIQDIRTGKIKTICQPIYAVSKTGRFALSLNFDRLALMRPDYGYFNRNITWDDMPDNSNDGIWYIDLEKNESKLIITLAALSNFRPSDTMKGARHKVNHIDIAPDGMRFMFLHRWIGPAGRFMRLLTADCINGGNLFYLTGEQMVSHNCWWGSKDIISFCRMADGRNRYVHFEDLHGFVGIIGDKDFCLDGHPSVSSDGTWMLTDDYPDKSRFSRLYLYDKKNKKKLLLGKFFQPLIYNGEKRIDLHPKWCAVGRQIAFESGHKGKRTLYILNIGNVLKNE